MLGLIRWFKDRSRYWAVDRYRREAVSFLGHVRRLSDNDIGFVLAIAAHQRNKLKEEGTDLFSLAELAAARPMYHHDLAKAVGALSRAKRAHDALGMHVWVHSLRAAAMPELREIGLDLWRELRRGVPHLAEQRAYFKEQTGFELDITRGGEVPPDLRPDGDAG